VCGGGCGEEGAAVREAMVVDSVEGAAGAGCEEEYLKVSCVARC